MCRLWHVVTPEGTLTYEYYPAIPQGQTPAAGTAPGRLSSLSGTMGVDLGFSYDGFLQTGVSWTGDVTGSVIWQYDNNSPGTCSPPSADALRMIRSSQNGLLTSATAGQLNESWTYNSYGELARYVVTSGASTLYDLTLDSSTQPRDALGRIVEKTEVLASDARVSDYSYDLQGRLTDVVVGGAVSKHYEYDDNGNRLRGVTDGTDRAGTVDDQDRLLTYGEFTYTYTPNGELLTKTDSLTGEVWGYSYDVLGNLRSVELPDGSQVEYVVDGQNRRVAKKIDGEVVQQWLWSGQLRIAAELDGSGSVVAQYIYGDKPNVPELILQDSKTYRVITDHLGSPVMVVNIEDATDVLFEARYDAWGNRTVLIGDEDAVPFGFAGGMVDADTGLVRFGARDYDPAIGRWASKDPIRFEGGQTNIYAYVGNDPVNFTDLMGFYGTNSCAYYTQQCATTGGAYYCSIAPAACDFFPKPDDPDPNDPYDNEGWNRCVRQCLQDRDRDRKPDPGNCPSNGGAGPRPSLGDIAEDHVVCMHECFFDML